MAQALSNLTVGEISLVDRPANSSVDPLTGKKTAHARVALFKRDTEEPGLLEETEEFHKALDGEQVVKDGKTYAGTTYPKSDFAYTPDDTPSHWKLRLTNKPGGAPDAGIVGAAVAALGKGFRGKKVQIPADALPGVKAKVRAAWRKANADKGVEEMPDVLKGETSMTLEELELKVTKMEPQLTTLTSENAVLKAENALVLKMSKKDRKLYASMDDDQRKAYMAADTDKRKAMMDKAAGEKKEKALKDSMDEATCKRFDKAGPVEKAAILEQVAKAAKAKAKDSEDKPDDADDNDDDEETQALKRDLAATTDRVVKAEAALTQITKQARLDAFSKRAEAELPNTAGSPVEKGEMLMGLADALPGGENGEAFKKILGQLKAADSAMEVHFKEVGKAGGASDGGDGVTSTLGKFNAKVMEISKRDKIDEPHAIEKAMFEAPQLYLDYEKEQHQRALAR